MNKINNIQEKSPRQLEQTAKEKNKLKKKKGVNFANLFIRISLQERVMFARHLAVGLKSGMTLQKSLQMIIDQTKSKSFKKILQKFIDDTTNGMFLSDSMEKYRSIFGELFINIVRVGEQSGTLIENLNYLSSELKKKKALKSKVRGALIYPVIILIATIGIVATLMIGVFPKILPVFSNLNIDLPITTRILIVVSTFMSNYTILLIIALFVFIAAIWWISHYDFYKRIWHRTLLSLPVIGKIVIKVNSTTFTRVLGLLLKSGVQIIEAVEITASTMDNYVYRREIQKGAEELRKGDFFSKYIRTKKKFFPVTLVNMIEVGENTGNLTENLAYLAEFYEGEVDETLKNLSSIIEPILLLIMGLLVGFIALSVITPIYSISQTLTL
ncbi:MAG: type II secretion system F family protein [bacterium]|nr:type II secretion system F family protein [bacterium]